MAKTTQHNVRARNLRVGDQIKLVTFMHTITKIKPSPGSMLEITAECHDNIGSIQAVVPYFNDRIVTVYIAQ